MAKKSKSEAKQPENKEQPTILEEFKDFLVRGNVIELAVGLTVGAGFTAVINSLVNNIILPPIGLLLQGSAFEELFIALDGGAYDSLEQAEKAGAPLLKYGEFIAEVIDFLLIAIAVFILIRIISKVRRELID